MATEADGKPTIEALEAERRRLQELGRNLAAERNRIQAAASQEISRLHDQLRDAADRAGQRERELELARRRLERKARGGKLAAFGLAAAKRSADRPKPSDDRDLADRERALAAATAALRVRESALDQKVTELVEAERRSAELLAARSAALEARASKLNVPQPAHPLEEEPIPGASRLDDRWTLLEAREAELAQAFTVLEHRERELEGLRDEFEAEQGRLASRERRLSDAEREAPLRAGKAATRQTVSFHEGLRALARRRAN